MRSLSILHVIRSDGFAGVEQFVLRLAVAQADAGHSVHVIGGDSARMGPPLEAAGVTHTATRNSTLAVASVVRGRSGQADIVNSHMTAADVAATFALALARHAPPLVSTRHFAGARGSIGPVPIDALVGRRVRAEISISKAVAAAIRRPSTVVHSGVPDAPVGTDRSRTVLIAQRLEPEKRTDLGIRAFAQSGLACRGWVLQIAGDGAERPALEALTAELGVKAEFLGFRTDVPQLLASAGMLLAPCPVEGLGLTVLEAISTGLPVVAADSGGHTEILESLDSRALYTPESPDAAARNLLSLADEDTGRAALGAAGQHRQRAEFSLAAQVAGTDAVYRAAIARAE